MKMKKIRVHVVTSSIIKSSFHPYCSTPKSNITTVITTFTRSKSYKLLPHRTGHASPLISATVVGYFNFFGEKRLEHHSRIEAVDSDGHLRSCPSGLGGNVGSLTTKLFELSDTLRRHKVDIACFQETRWKGSRAREGNGYKLWYSCSSLARNGVGVVVAKRLKDDVVRVARRSDMIMAILVVIDGEAVNVISTYASQVGLSDVEKKRFGDALDELMRECPADERLIIGGDLNGHIRDATDGYEGVHEGFGFGERNEEGRSILDFATTHDMRGPQSIQGLQGLPRRDMLIATQIGKAVETFRATVSEKLLALEEDMSAHNADQMWNTLASVIRDVAKDFLGVASESARTDSTHRESWWFREEGQTKVAMKQSRFKELLACSDGNQEDIDLAKERYKVAKREAKIEIAQRMGIRNVRCIKDEGGRNIVREEDIKKRWGEYFSSLFNESPPIESRPERSGDVGSSRHQIHYDYYHSRINQGEVGAALQRMGRNKVVGPDQIPIEAWRFLEDEGVKWLTCLFNKIFLGSKMSDEWRLSEVISIYKSKDDAQACSNYRGIKILSYTMKLWERVIERRLRRETRVSENQFGFMSGQSTTEVIYLLKSLMDKYRERQRDLHMAFLDLEKTYDSVSRELLWRTLRDKGTPRRFSKVIKDMYEGVKTRVRTIIGKTEFFLVEVGLHQGSAVSPYLFALILDELSRGIQESIPWCMIFVDDIVLIAELAEGLNIIIEKYEVLHQEVDLCIGDRVLQPKESFRVLRKPTYTDNEKLYAHHEKKHGFHWMIGCIDRTDWSWKNCSVALRAQFAMGDHGPDPFNLLEAIASQDLWICHAFFGVSGMNNDVNVLRQSPLFNDLKVGKAPDVPFVANNVTYKREYYLTDGIYPEWSILIKSISNPGANEYCIRRSTKQQRKM
nr:retrovirus-related Pol polyprotein LINE-1 [Tanacetum cinerariifolium]